MAIWSHWNCEWFLLVVEGGVAIHAEEQSSTQTHSSERVDKTGCFGKADGWTKATRHLALDLCRLRMVRATLSAHLGSNGVGCMTAYIWQNNLTRFGGILLLGCPHWSAIFPYDHNLSVVMGRMRKDLQLCENIQSHPSINQGQQCLTSEIRCDQFNLGYSGHGNPTHRFTLNLRWQKECNFSKIELLWLPTPLPPKAQNYH